MTTCDNMDGPRVYFSKWNKSVRQTQILWFHLCVESKEQNEWTNKIETDS